MLKIERLNQKGSRFFIKNRDKECDFHPNFKLFFQKKLSNLYYLTEVQADITLTNFTG